MSDLKTERVERFRGYHFRADLVVALAPADVVRQGPLANDYEYGVRVLFAGAELVIIAPTLDGKKSMRAAREMRTELKNLIWPQLATTIDFPQ